MADLYLPNTVDELIDLLDENYPHRCPDLHQSEREIFYIAGQRALVDWLINLKERTEEQQLKTLME